MNNIALDDIKKQIAEDSFKSVYSYSSAVISLKTKNGGVLIAITTTNTAIRNKTRKLISKLLSLAVSQTTIYSYVKSPFVSETVTYTVS